MWKQKAFPNQMELSEQLLFAYINWLNFLGVAKKDVIYIVSSEFLKWDLKTSINFICHAVLHFSYDFSNSYSPHPPTQVLLYDYKWWQYNDYGIFLARSATRKPGI